jgi:putative ATP-dependent endonuclease of OLD family
MKLRTLRIRNFRCYGSINIEVDSMHALVGSNNAGKSTILRALDFLFNPSTRKVNEESFYQKDTSNRIEVEALFADLQEDEREILKPYLRPDGTFHVMRTATLTDDKAGDEDGEDGGESKVKIQAHYCSPQPKIDWLNPAKISTKAIDAWWAEKGALVHNGESFAALLGTKKPTKGDWLAKAEEFAKAQLKPEDLEDTWIANPQGYPGVLKATLPHYELIPAVREATDESKVTKTNPFGRLIYEIMRTLDAEVRGELEAALRATTVRLNRDGKEKRAPRVAEIESTIQGFLTEVMPADLELEFQAPTIEVLLTTPKIHIDDGFRGSVDGKGHGLQRAVIFAILRAYAKLVTERPEKTKRTLILGVEEPELYMHPTAQRTIRRVLRTIANGGDQVLFSTHSPLMVDVAYFDEIVRIEAPDRGGAPLPPGACPKRFQLPVQSLIDDLESRVPKLKGTLTPASMRERYSHAYTTSRNEGFFARRVILVEGQTETYSLPLYAQGIGQDLDGLGVAVVECGGKGQMDRLYRVFCELGIICYPVFDYDLGNTDKGVRRDTDGLLALLGRADIKDPATTVITDTFSCFSKDWEAGVSHEIPDYAKLKAEAKDFLGLKDESKPLVARYVAAKLVEADPPIVPPTVKAIIEKALAAKHPGTCLKPATVAAS